MTTPGNKLSKYSKGMKVSCQQNVSLTSYWPLVSNVNDAVGSNNGTATAVTYTSGLLGGNTATFNGTTSKIVLTDAASLRPAGDFTIGVWIKTSTTGVYQGIYQAYADASNMTGIVFAINPSNLLYFSTAPNTGASTNSTLTGSINPCDGNWHYAEITLRQNWGQMYIDGKLNASGYMYTPAYSSVYERIGCTNNSGSDMGFFNGQIGDLFIISGSSGTTATGGYALDEQTIANQYALQVAQGASAIAVTKMFLLTGISYSNPNTTLTMYGGTDFTLTNSTISNPMFSLVEQPYGFNRNPDKWSVYVQSSASAYQLTPVNGTWYNVGSINISIPVGSWELTGKLPVAAVNAATSNSQQSLAGALSTSSSSISDSELSSDYDFLLPILSLTVGVIISINKKICLSTRTVYYAIEASRNTVTVPTTLFIYSSYITTIPVVIKAVSQYI